MTLLIAFGLATSTPVVAPKMPLDSTEAIKAEIVNVFGKDSEIMLKVAECESNTSQFNKDGSVIRGIENNSDYGIFQINTYYWLDISNKLSYNIYTIEGNIKMAKYIYEKQGIRAWKASSHCHYET